jgi:hypothetical protein
LANISGEFKTATEGELQPNQWGLGYWPENHPKNPKNIVLTTVPSFGEYLEQGLKTMASASTEKLPTLSKEKKKQEPIEEEEITTTRRGNFQGKAPDVFDGDRTKSKAFISDLKIYFRINRNHPDVKNYHARVFVALSFIKGPNVVNWVDAQFQRAEDNLIDLAGGDETDIDLWNDFVNEFKRAYISTTAKESAYVKLQSLTMKGDHLDEYIADFATLIGELEWDEDSEIACHHFRQGLPTPLVRQILQHEGNPDSLTGWEKVAQIHHARWAMTKAFGYTGKGSKQGGFKPHFHPKGKKKERDPDAMDVDFTQMSQLEKEQLLKSGSCFRCKKKGHVARNCPQKTETAIHEAVVKEPKQKPEKKKDDPPTYDSLLKQINACTMGDRQRLMEAFSNTGSDDEQDF